MCLCSCNGANAERFVRDLLSERSFGISELVRTLIDKSRLLVCKLYE